MAMTSIRALSDDCSAGFTSATHIEHAAIDNSLV